MQIFTLPSRIKLVFGTFLLTILLYVDRACISAAKTEITGDLGFDLKEFGWIMAMFTLGYALFQTPSGILADRKGPRGIISSIVMAWSVLTAMTGAAWNYISMLVIRFLFGAAEAGAFPSLAKVVYNWFPIRERGIVQGINFSGSRLGAAFALPLVAWMLTQMGWRYTFMIFGMGGVLFAILWYLLFRNKPEESANISQKEKDYILNKRQPGSRNPDSTLSAGRLFGSSNVWMVMVQYVCSNFTFYFTLSWMFPYLKERFALGGIETGFYAMIPLMAGAAGNWFSGFLVDLIYKKNRWVNSRRIPAIIGFILAAFGMLMMSQVETPEVSILYLSIAVFGADMTLSPSWAFCIDIGKEHSGAVSGTMNMAGNLGAFITIIAFPYLLEWTGIHDPFFYICSGLSLFAIIMWMLMRPDNPLIQD